MSYGGDGSRGSLRSHLDHRDSAALLHQRDSPSRVEACVEAWVEA